MNNLQRERERENLETARMGSTAIVLRVFSVEIPRSNAVLDLLVGLGESLVSETDKVVST